MSTLVPELYEQHLIAARGRFASNPAVSAIFDPAADSDLLERFLISFCALGVRMTEPVESWISRAGKRCIETGFPELGRALCTHARHEANHHFLMIADTRSLVKRRNARLQTDLSADSLLARPATSGTECYVKLHEDVIAGNAPFAQIAIEYEIERLSVEFGARLVRHCCDRMGNDVLACMSFVTEHAALDVGHTNFNGAELGKLLAISPAFAPHLANAGSRALDAYAMFVADCLTLAADLRINQKEPDISNRVGLHA